MDRATLWQALFRYRCRPIGERTVVRLSQRVLATAAALQTISIPGAEGCRRESLLEALAQHARDAGLVVLATAVEQQRGGLIAAMWQTASAIAAIGAEGKDSRRAIGARTAFGLQSEDDDVRREPIYIGNAGLCWPISLYRLFTRSTCSAAMKRQDAAARQRPPRRARALLQYLVDGRTERLSRCWL